MLKNKKKVIPLNIPFLKGKEKKYLMDCLKSNYVSSVGPFVREFEYKFLKKIGSRYAVACSSGTSALHLSLLSLNIGEGDLVIAPNLTFVATINSIKYVGAEPILIDIDENNGHLDLKLLEDFLLKQCFVKGKNCYHKISKKVIKAIIPVHILGHAVDMLKLRQLSKKFFLQIIEDAAEALGVNYKNKNIGTYGAIGCFSFNGNKTITSGSGGMVVTDSKSLALRIKYLSTQAKDDEKEFIHNEIGYNYRMSNIHAAIGLAQLENLHKYLNLKKKISKNYIDAFKGIKGISWIRPIKKVNSSWWLFTLINKQDITKVSTNKIIRDLNLNGIQARKLWKPINMLLPYKKAIFIGTQKSLELYNSAISLPSSASLKKSDQDFVTQTLIAILKTKK
ncbi:MAG: hypothetical protein CBB97_02080 [Candidatus Endolissoclinum sp. TMED37]|nr:MAG: hypothetical protein CBB97_02080 [Candidatus Endolissoclinum sp. TMED37]